MAGTWLVLFILLWVVCLALLTLVLGLSRRVDRVEQFVLPSGGAAVPTDPTKGRLVGANVAEQIVKSGIEGAAGGVAGVVLFVSDECGWCRALAGDVQSRLEKVAGAGVASAVGTRVTIVTDREETYKALGATAIVVDQRGEVQSGFGIESTPTGLAIDEYGVVRGAMIANRLSDIEQLARLAQSTGLEVLAPA